MRDGTFVDSRAGLARLSLSWTRAYVCMRACPRAKRERNFVIEAFKLRLGDSVAETGLVADHLPPSFSSRFDPLRG